MIVRARIPQTDEILEAESFKVIYDAALLNVMEYLKKDVLCTIIIEVDGQEKYRIAPIIWWYGGELIGKSIDVVRLADWSVLTIRTFSKKGCMI